MNEWSPKPHIGLLPNIALTPIKKDGKHEERNFNRFQSQTIAIDNTPKLSRRVSISPLHEHEKIGPKWHETRSKSVLIQN